MKKRSKRYQELHKSFAAAIAAKRESSNQIAETKTQSSKLFCKNISEALDILYSHANPQKPENLRVCLLYRNMDQKKQENVIRTTVSLPKPFLIVRVIFLGNRVDFPAAMAAGATECVAQEDFSKLGNEISIKNSIICILESFLPNLKGKTAIELGKNGVMPSKKMGTVIPDQDLTKKDALNYSGILALKISSDASLKVNFGKTSSPKEESKVNLEAIVSHINQEIKANSKNKGVLDQITVSLTISASLSIKGQGLKSNL